MEYSHEKITASQGLPFWYYIHTTEEASVVPRHWHRSIELNYTVSGNVDYLYMGGVTFKTTPKDLFLVNSNEIHAIRAEAQENRKVLSIILPRDFLKKEFPSIDKRRFTCLGKKTCVNSPNLDKIYIQISDLLEIFVKTTEKPKIEETTLLQKSLVYEILYLLLTHFSSEKLDSQDSKKSEKYFQRLTKIITYIEENYQEEISVTDIAEAFHFTPEYFSRFFKRHMGITVGQYIDEIRLQTAYQLLVNTDRELSQIAMMSGFPNEKSFTRVFKKYYHETPGKYKKCR